VHVLVLVHVHVHVLVLRQPATARSAGCARTCWWAA